MPQEKLPQQKNSANKEIERMFVGMRMGSSVAFAKPKTGKRVIVMLFFILALAAGGLGAWRFLLQADSLAARLPRDVDFYARVVLPREDAWFNEFFFWRSPSNLGARAARLYQKLDVVSWEGTQFATDLLPFFSGSLESARFDSGTFIVRTTLQNPAAWFGAVGFTGAYTGTVERFSAPLSGWWPLAAGSGEEFYWQLSERTLYLSNTADFTSGFLSSPSETLADELAAQGAESGVAVLYSANAESIGHALGGELEAALAAFSEPIVLSIESKGDTQWMLQMAGAGNASESQSFGVSLPVDGDTGFLLRSVDMGGAWSAWSGLYPLAATFGDLLKELYQTDISNVAGLFAKRNGLIAIESSTTHSELGPGWLLFIETQETNPDIAVALERVGAALFAISHPLAVERTLTDGSTMVELRAETEGIAWEEFGWSHNEEPIALFSLRGQGEEFGYFTGYIADRGYVFTSSLTLLERYLPLIKGVRVSDSPSVSCSTSYPMSVGALVRADVMFGDAFLPSVIDHVVFGESSSGMVVGCVGFK